jgi:hypothetical protein
MRSSQASRHTLLGCGRSLEGAAVHTGHVSLHLEITVTDNALLGGAQDIVEALQADARARVANVTHVLPTPLSCQRAIDSRAQLLARLLHRLGVGIAREWAAREVREGASLLHG